MRNLRLYFDLPDTHKDFKLTLWVGGDLSKYKNTPYIKRVGGRICEGGGDLDDGYKFFITDASNDVLNIMRTADFLEIVKIFSTTSPTLNKGTIIYAYEQVIQ